MDNNDLNTPPMMAPEEMIQNLDATISDLRKKLDEKDKKLDEKDKKLEEKDKKLEEKDKKLEEKDKKLEEKDKELRAVRAELMCQRKAAEMIEASRNFGIEITHGQNLSDLLPRMATVLAETEK